MKNRTNITIGIATGALLLSSCAPERKAPNLVFVFSDQQTFDMLGCYGNQQIITPNLDRFANQGIRFTHCFSNSPICTPFRGMLLSGKHSINNGCYVNDKPLIPGNGKKFAEVLRDAGYNTAYIGKWHLLGGDRDRPIPKGEMRYGFDELFLTNNCHVDFRAGNCFYWNDDGEKVFFNEWEVYGQTWQALDYLDTRKGSNRPFALFVSWHPPHDWGKFKGGDSLMHYKYDGPDELMAMYNRDSIKVRPGMKDSPDLRRMYHGQMAMTTGVDIAFGQLMLKLKQLGIEDNTLVVFTSDHGDMLEFDQAVYPKQYPHDYSLHIPYMMRWPGKFVPGSTTGLLYSALDMMPTILGLMGLEVPEECDGKNLSKPIFSGNENAVDFVPVWLYEGKGFRGVITREYTFATQKGATAGSLHSVLFDRVNDPCQLNNRFADPSMNAVREKLWKITADWMKIYGDEFFTEEEMEGRGVKRVKNERRVKRVKSVKSVKSVKNVEGVRV
jgi:arylsulfatase A-like enzyme